MGGRVASWFGIAAPTVDGQVFEVGDCDQTFAIQSISLFRLGFAEVREWSKPQPTGRTYEVMRVLTRYVLAE